MENVNAVATVPEWVAKTPEDNSYELAMIDYLHTAAPVQAVILTRDEYITLKIRLAEMRGHMVKPPVMLPEDLGRLKEVALLLRGPALKQLQKVIGDIESNTANRLGECHATK
jgi:hypothetical protein